ncbi:phage tail protein [Pararhizobium mangrovi]|uniref:Fibronectin type-III domain-containing protein n=1 Tax=Pararhizobium mangrovi TaxID=2590452 RepID=A0A506UE94_9HYPH|nr:hypothetical protein [Pararhizobium mangrovi]TPW31175.1 hypothetical protein FJU11_02965 [Pararhizobium mangrovi]
MRVMRPLKMLAGALLMSTALTAPAKADPVSGLVALISSGLNAVGATVATQAIVGQAIVGVAGSALGQAAIVAGLSYAANSLLANKPSAPPPQALQSNFTTDQKKRYYASGELRLGGIVTFAEAKDGRLYKQIAHADAEVTEDIQMYLDNIPVTFHDGGNGVETDEFYESDEDPYFYLFSRHGTVDQAAQEKLTSVFSEWTERHVGAGVSDTLLRVRQMSNKHRARYYVFRGVLGLGEPDITRAAMYGRYYDPRNDSTRGGDGDERPDQPSTWGPSKGNIALLIAQHRMDPERFAMSPDDINWANIAEQADICDETVVDRYGDSIKRYRGSVIIDKSEESNIEAENRLMAACDAIRFEDEDGRFGIYVGKYVEPDVVLTDADVFEIESNENDDGETDYTHYYGIYTEPAFAYKESSTAQWVSDDWKQGQPIKTKDVTLHVLLDHNTGVRAVKATARRQSAKRSLAVTAGLRARRLRSRRFVRLSLGDANLSGVYEVASLAPGEDGLTQHLTLISTDASNWTLLPGEEGDRPNLNITVQNNGGSIDNIDPADMQIVSQTIEGAGVRFVADFPVPSRPDYIVQIQYREKGDTIWDEFAMKTEDGAGRSGGVAIGTTYQIRWRVTTITGSSSGWSDIVEIKASGDSTAPAEGVLGTLTVINSTVQVPWRNANDRRVSAALIYRSATNDFSSATDLYGPIYSSPNQQLQQQDNPGSGTWYYWVVMQSATGVASDPDGPGSVSIA